jgi:ribose transport system ATP-binding protein
MDIAQGEVHALIGHNGSGKSTLVKILAGVYQPDPGSEAEIDGHPLIWQSPADSERLGLRVVHQNLGLVNALSVTENVAMGAGYAARGFGRIPWRQEHRLVGEQMSRLGYDIDPKQPVGSLPAAARSAVAVARALMPREGRTSPHIVLLDEVTATMPDVEIARLLDLVRTLREHSIGVLYVSHHLEEVIQIADSVTVLRDGQRVGSRPIGDLTQERLADLLVGGTEWRDHNQTHQVIDSDVDVKVEPLRLTVTGLAGPGLHGVSFDAGPGRIVGIAGITGSGREEILPMIFGAMPRAGSVLLGSAEVPPGQPKASVAMGMTLIPANRATSAVVPTQNVRENLTLSALHGTRAVSLLKIRPERQRVRRWISDLAIRGAATDGSINTLSGGNQQKVIIARCLNVEPRVLLLDEPTQGVDIGAVADIHGQVRKASLVSTVVVSSSDSYELASLCTEVIVLHRGHIVGRLLGDDITEENLDRLQLAPPQRSEAASVSMSTSSPTPERKVVTDDGQ